MSTQGRRRGGVAIGIILLIISMAAVDAIQATRTLAFADKSNHVELAKAPKGTVKTIQSGNGDVVDCVDIYRQPAFDHPLLKNHTLQMKPSFREEEDENHRSALEGSVSDCPEGTVPIVRETSKYGFDVGPFVPPYPFNTSRVHLDSSGIDRDRQEYAFVFLYDNGETYHGARGTLNLWTPWVVKGEISTSQIWMLGGSNPNNANILEAGWMVEYEADDRPAVPRLFTHWTNDGYRSTGCFNLQCPGFVQTSSTIGPGSLLQPASIYNGHQTSVNIEVNVDLQTGNWWFLFQGKEVGYWPAALVPNLREGAGAINWGGQITNNKNNGQHTATQMGSGHFPRDGYFTKSAFISNLAYLQKPVQQFVPTPRDKLEQRVTKRECYDLVLGPSNVQNFGTHFYFGGTGLSEKCP